MYATGANLGTRHFWLGLALVLASIEATLMLADAGLIGSRLWRSFAYQYGGFWAGLLHGWRPNYAVQPIAMFLTYTGLHADWQHLLGNLLTLAWLGSLLDHVYGAMQFAALFVLSALGGGVGFGLFSSSPRPMVGASGAIMGLIAVWIATDARVMARDGAGRAEVLRMVLLRVIMIASLNWFAWFIEAGGLAWQAHLGGFLAAALAMVAIPALRPNV